MSCCYKQQSGDQGLQRDIFNKQYWMTRYVYNSNGNWQETAVRWYQKMERGIEAIFPLRMGLFIN